MYSGIYSGMESGMLRGIAGLTSLSRMDSGIDSGWNLECWLEWLD